MPTINTFVSHRLYIYIYSNHIYTYDLNESFRKYMTAGKNLVLTYRNFDIQTILQRIELKTGHRKSSYNVGKKNKSIKDKRVFKKC